MRAVTRLAKLFEANLLASDESRLFAEAVWARVDPATGLPKETGFYNFALLQWPEVQAGLAAEKLKQLLLTRTSGSAILSVLMILIA